MIKRLLIPFLFAMLCVILFACADGEDNKAITNNEPNYPNGESSLMSFGNQSNQLNSWLELKFIKDGKWVYSISDEYQGIIRFQIDNPQSHEMIYNYGEDATEWLHQISVFGDWIFFLEDTGDHARENMDLYKIKADGSKKAKLLSNVDGYILTKENIYYQKSGIDQGKGIADNVTISSININSGRKQKITDVNNTAYTMNYLIGMDNGWVYYAEFTSDGGVLGEPEKFNIYKILPNGMSKQKVIDEAICDQYTDAIFNVFVQEDNQLFFFRIDGYVDGVDLIKKKNDSKETLLATFSGGDKYTLNKEGNWLFFCEGKRLYRINAYGKNEKELVYKASDYIEGFLLFDGDILVSTAKNSIYIKENGKKVEL